MNILNKICKHCNMYIDGSFIHDETKRCLYNQGISGCLVCEYDQLKK